MPSMICAQTRQETTRA